MYSETAIKCSGKFVISYLWMTIYKYITINLRLLIQYTGVLIIVCVCKWRDSAFHIRAESVNYKYPYKYYHVNKFSDLNMQALEVCCWFTFIFLQYRAALIKTCMSCICLPGQWCNRCVQPPCWRPGPSETGPLSHWTLSPGQQILGLANKKTLIKYILYLAI